MVKVEVMLAVEEGVKVTEADPNVRSVGLGGYPDREGIVTLGCMHYGQRQ